MTYCHHIRRQQGQKLNKVVTLIMTNEHEQYYGMRSQFAEAYSTRTLACRTWFEETGVKRQNKGDRQ